MDRVANARWELAVSYADFQIWRLPGINPPPPGKEHQSGSKPWGYVQSVGLLVDNQWTWSICDDWDTVWRGPLPFEECKAAAEAALRALNSQQTDV